MLTRFSVTQESRILEVERGFIGSVPSSLLIVVPDIPLDVHILPTFLISVLKIFIAHYIGIQKWWVSFPPPQPHPSPTCCCGGGRSQGVNPDSQPEPDKECTHFKRTVQPMYWVDLFSSSFPCTILKTFSSERPLGLPSKFIHSNIIINKLSTDY